jgi:glycine C-acetyltransferase
MYGKIQQHLQNELNAIEQNCIFKRERIITSPQGAEITVNGKTVLIWHCNTVCLRASELG